MARMQERGGIVPSSVSAPPLGEMRQPLPFSSSTQQQRHHHQPIGNNNMMMRMEGGGQRCIGMRPPGPPRPYPLGFMRPPPPTLTTGQQEQLPPGPGYNENFPQGRPP